tara:strand:+ start:101 stop:562 length:462 start_codon:yes stop_codon:yes gene_type:complete
MKNTKITIKKKEENMTKKYQIEAGSKVEMVVGNKIKKVTLAYTSILTQDHLLYIDTSNKGTFYNFLIGNSQYIVSSKLVKEAPEFKDIALTNQKENMNNFKIDFVENNKKVTEKVKGGEDELAPFISQFFNKDITNLVITNIETGQAINYNKV